MHYFFRRDAADFAVAAQDFPAQQHCPFLLDDELAAQRIEPAADFMLCLFVPAGWLFCVLTTIPLMQLRDGNLDELLSTKAPVPLAAVFITRATSAFTKTCRECCALRCLGWWRSLRIRRRCSTRCRFYLFAGWRSKLHDRFCRKVAGLGSRWRRFWLTVVGLGVAGLLLLIFRRFVNYLQVDFQSTCCFCDGARSRPLTGLPLMPLLLLRLGVQLYGYCELQRIRLLEKLATVYLDLLEELEDDRGLRGKISEIAAYLGSPSVWQILAGFLLALFQAVTVLSELVTLEVAPMHLCVPFSDRAASR